MGCRLDETSLLRQTPPIISCGNRSLRSPRRSTRRVPNPGASYILKKLFARPFVMPRKHGVACICASDGKTLDRYRGACETRSRYISRLRL